MGASETKGIARVDLGRRYRAVVKPRGILHASSHFGRDKMKDWGL